MGRSGSGDHSKLMNIIAIMERASGTKEVAARVREMYRLAEGIERERAEAVEEAARCRSAAHASEMEAQKREADAYARGVADGYRECAEQIAKKIGYEPCT